MVQDSELARDLTQDTFLKAFTSLNRTRRELNLSAWLHTIARNLCLDYWRKSKRQSQEVDFNDQLPGFLASHLPDPDHALANKELQYLLQQALVSLKREQRQALVLREIDGLSYEEAARIMRISVTAFTSLLNRARVRFVQIILPVLYPRAKKGLFGPKECLSLLQWFDPLDWPDDVKLQVTLKARSYFERHASQFSSVRPQRYPRDLDEMLLSRIPVSTDMVGGDFGTGAGHIAEKLAGRLARVHAVDISPKMLSLASQRFQKSGLKNIELSAGDINQLPLPAQSVDIAYCAVVLHHVLDPGETIKELARVLKKGGQLVIADLATHNHGWINRDHRDLWAGFRPDQVAGWLKEASLEAVWVDKPQGANFNFDYKGGEVVRVPLIVAGGTKG